ncbi:MAG: VOC family protein [Candidatus Heimdallarchaeota archaeon]|nr:VOC family protein [Candidatus Heimdallarchaeota archaeon]MCK4954977.1 VOC family protein [Candidatus Heimdallarchaeota archaeon]
MRDEKNFPISYRRMYFQVSVMDLERAKNFYEDVFGFEISWYESPEVGWCEFHLPGSNANLGLNASRKDEHKAADFSVLTLDVEDLEGTKKYLDSKGVETTEISDNPNYISFFNMKDSEGNRIQIVGDPRITT